VGQGSVSPPILAFEVSSIKMNFLWLAFFQRSGGFDCKGSLNGPQGPIALAVLPKAITKLLIAITETIDACHPWQSAHQSSAPGLE
jgi:hypothetical protein